MTDQTEPETTSKPKQIIVMRTDLNMRKGKMIAQGAHASMKVFFDRFIWGGWTSGQFTPFVPDQMQILANIDEIMFQWATGELFTKIALKVKSEEELVEIYEKAKAAGLPCALIEDRGLTEFHGVVTKTCCAIGPALPENIDPITGHLVPL